MRRSSLKGSFDALTTLGVVVVFVVRGGSGSRPFLQRQRRQRGAAGEDSTPNTGLNWGLAFGGGRGRRIYGWELERGRGFMWVF